MAKTPWEDWSAIRMERHRSRAQTERRGGAGPVRGLLGGKDLTGRLVLVSRQWSVARSEETDAFQQNNGLLTTDPCYQSAPSSSPPLGVTAAHQVVRLMPGASVRTLPSARPTCMPPA